MTSQYKTELLQSATSRPSEEVFVKTDNANLYCRVLGKGDPLIILHGGPGLSMDYLLPSLDELARDNLIIFYDQRGNGKSTGKITKENMTLRKFTDDLRTIQNYFNFEKIGLLGHSWGAYLAMNYAAKYYNHVNKLILLNSIPVFFEATSTSEEARKDPYEEMINAIIESEAFNNNDTERLVKFYKDLFQFFFYDPKLVDELNLNQMSAIQVKNSALIHKLFEENLFHKSPDLSDKLSKLHSIPTLIVHGNAHDLPVSVAEKIHSLIKGSTLVILECGHFPYLERPKEFFDCISKFNSDYEP